MKVGDRECRAPEFRAKATEGGEDPGGAAAEGLSGVWGAERSDGDGGTGEALPGLVALRVAAGASCPITGSRREVGVVPGGRRRRS